MKKIIVAILGITMILAQVPLVFAEGDATYYWLEAEDAECSANYHNISNSSASGEHYMVVYETTSGEYTVDFTFLNNKEDKYDIWFLSGRGASRKLTKFKWSINDSERKTASYAAADEVYSDIYDENTCEFYWNKIAEKQNLSEGETSIKFVVADRSEVNNESGEKAWFNYIDAAVVVPSSWKWEPDNLTKPEEPEKVPADFVWIELEDPDAKGEYLTTSHSYSAASEGEILYANGVKPPEGAEEDLSYSFEIDKENEYDIWYLGIQTNVAHLSGLKWGIDTVPTRSNGVEQAAPTSYNITVLGSSFPMYWQKMSKEALAVGEHTLNLRYIPRSLGSSFVVAADSVMIVPSELEWIPQENNLICEQIKGEVVARLFANNYREYFDKDFSSVTDNILLPDYSERETFKNQLGARITFSADDFDGREVIASDGTVTRPFATASDDAKVNFYINADYQNSDERWIKGSYAIPMTVKKWQKYEITDRLSVNKQKLTPADTITATASSNIHVSDPYNGTVTILMVLHDKNGKMQNIAMGEERGFGQKSVNASITLPDDVNGSVLRVYLLNGLFYANRLEDVITITD